jgi:hypothetical protein
MVLVVAVALLVGLAGPASAQFFNFGFQQRPAPMHRGGGGWFGRDNPFFAPFQQTPPPAPKRPPENYSHAPPPEKRDTAAERNVLVLGDAMADWLGYGLEDALTETPDMGVIRKFRTVSGLIQYQPRGEPADWVAAAKAILPAEKPAAIVVMLGLHDRIPIREPAPEKDGKKADKDKTDAAKSAEDDKPGESEPVDDEADGDQLAIMAPEKSARSRNGIAQFRSDRWVELYNKKIDEMIAVLKSKGVPVLWVGLPAVRGAKSTSDMLFLDSLYRDAAGKAGITYVDIWDGFVDDNGRYIQQGPDFEGQIRRLRSYDGVFFTKAGARKLAHYVEREITRVLASRSAPITLPSEPAPETEAKPGQPAPRPLYGPIVPLVASSVGTDQLLGGAGARPAAVDALVARTLVKGEPLSAPPGRADDFVWPRRAIGNEPAPVGEPAVATTAPDHPPAAVAPPKPKKPRAPHQAEETAQQGGAFGYRSAPPPQQQRQHPAAPRPPADFGFSPGGFFSGLFSR